MFTRMRSFHFRNHPISLLLLHSCFTLALLTSSDINPPYPKAISDLKEAIVKGLGFPVEEFKTTGFDPREAQVGAFSGEYEFDVEIDRKVIPFKLLEDVNRWEYVDLPSCQVKEPGKPGDKNGLVEKRNWGNGLPVFRSSWLDPWSSGSRTPRT